MVRGGEGGRSYAISVCTRVLYEPSCLRSGQLMQAKWRQEPMLASIRYERVLFLPDTPASSRPGSIEIRRTGSWNSKSEVHLDSPPHHQIQAKPMYQRYLSRNGLDWTFAPEWCEERAKKLAQPANRHFSSPPDC